MQNSHLNLPGHNSELSNKEKDEVYRGGDRAGRWLHADIVVQGLQAEEDSVSLDEPVPRQDVSNYREVKQNSHATSLRLD